MYRIWCRYEPEHENVPAGRRGQWRVVECMPWQRWMHAAVGFSYTGENYLSIASTKRYPRGSIIRPHKELKRVLVLRKMERMLEEQAEKLPVRAIRVGAVGAPA